MYNDFQVLSSICLLKGITGKVNEAPPAPVDEFPMGVAQFEPVNATFDKPVDVKIPLGIKLPPGSQIPIKKFEKGVWKTVGTATVDETGLSAAGGVQEFGQLAVQPKVEIETVEEEPEEKVVETIEIPKEKTTVEVEVSDSIEFPGGLPEGITVEYANALIQRELGISTGPKKIVLQLPELHEVAKPAAPLEPDAVTLWEQSCGYDISQLSTSGTINIKVITPAGTTIFQTLPYEAVVAKVRTHCERVWIEHTQ